MPLTKGRTLTKKTAKSKSFILLAFCAFLPDKSGIVSVQAAAAGDCRNLLSSLKTLNYQGINTKLGLPLRLVKALNRI